MSTLLILIVLVVDKDFESERIILILSYGESIVREEEPVSAASIAIQQLVSFPIASSMSGAHCEIDVRHGWFPPLLEVFLEFELFVEGEYAFSLVFFVSELVQFAFYVPSCKCLVPI